MKLVHLSLCFAILICELLVYGQGVSPQGSVGATPPCCAAVASSTRAPCCRPRVATTETAAADVDSKDRLLSESAPIEFVPYTEWLPPAARKSLAPRTATYVNQDGKAGKLHELLDIPSALIFFYTRCRNQYKCPAAVANMAALQKTVGNAGLGKQVRLLMVSYEPQNDTPSNLNTYGSSRGIQYDDNAIMLRLDSKQLPALIDAMDVPVNYNAGWVNVHGVALYLLDRRGRFVRTYHTLIWDNEKVTDDLRRLVAESK